MNNFSEMRSQVLLTLQVSLLGMVTRNLYAVLVSWSENEVNVRMLFDRCCSQDDVELASEVESEMMAGLPKHTVLCHAQACDPSVKISLQPGEVFVFRRAPTLTEAIGAEA